MSGGQRCDNRVVPMSESKEFHRPVKRGNPGRVRELPNSGTDLAGQSADDRRALIGLTPEAEGFLLHVAPEDFRRGRSRRFGPQPRGNPRAVLGSDDSRRNWRLSS